MLSPGCLQRRSDLLQAVRTFFFRRKYIEVDTPLRLPSLIPEVNIIPFSSADWFLQTSPEICMKRLLAAGCSQIFQICHCFRQEELGRYHLSEFTMLEWYQTGWDYHQLMDECEELIRFLVKTGAESGSGKEQMANDCIHRDGYHISVNRPWPRLRVDDVFWKYTGMSAREACEKGSFDRLLVEKIEPQLGFQQPVFLVDYPAELASLARYKKSDPAIAERFELYICGIEIANGFSELTDQAEQRHRFEKERAEMVEYRNEMVPQPEKFLDDLKNLPECAGIALGLDRLFMILLQAFSLADAATFAQEDL